MTVRILVVAGSDSGGGAGIQADIKTVSALGGHAMTAITAITAQNTLGVQAVEQVPADIVLQQMASCVEDIGVDAIKIGMLGSEEVVRAVAAVLVAAPEINARSVTGHARKALPPAVGRFPIVLDPVMVATSGSELACEAVVRAMRARLFPLATVLTPNLPELSRLSGDPLTSLGAVREAGMALAREFGFHVLAKGGHAAGPTITDLLIAPDGETLVMEQERVDTPHTHGTGCTLASAIAVGLGKGLDLPTAVVRARKFVRLALQAAPLLGQGHGPMGQQFVSLGEVGD